MCLAVLMATIFIDQTGLNIAKCYFNKFTAMQG